MELLAPYFWKSYINYINCNFFKWTGKYALEGTEWGHRKYYLSQIVLF